MSMKAVKIINPYKTGAFTLGEGLQKGTYKVRIAVRAAGNDDYLEATRIAVVRICVK